MTPPEKGMTLPTKRDRPPGFTPRGAAIATAEPPASPQAAPTPAQEPAAAAAPETRAPAAVPPESSKTPKVTRATSDRTSRERGTIATATAPEKPGGDKLVFNTKLVRTELEFLRSEPGRFAEEQQVQTNVTELINAMIYGVRRGEVDLTQLVRSWRRDLHGF